MAADARAMFALLLTAALTSCESDAGTALDANAGTSGSDERRRLRVWAFERSLEARESSRRELGLDGTASRAAAEFERLRRREGVSDAELAEIRAEGEGRHWADSEGCRPPADSIRQHALVVAPEPHRPLRGVHPAGLESEIAGVVILDAVIEASGEVGAIAILKGLPGGLDAAAVHEVRGVGWLPALLCGRPVAAHYNVSVDFRR
ncbi:MAG: hypothetical protein AMXMBFR36_06340 [Acidobacteriota bacterium]